MTSEGECVTKHLWYVHKCAIVLLFSFANSSISCLSREFEGDILADAVVVRIDKAVINQTGVGFDYREDPDFTAVTPKTVIPG